jgi:hypothetical protein
MIRLARDAALCLKFLGGHRKRLLFPNSILQPGQHGNRESAISTLDEIKAMCDDLIKAHGKYLPAYR